MRTLSQARHVSDACADKRRAPQTPQPERYVGPSYVDPHDVPFARELFGLEALNAWTSAGGDARVFARQA